MDLFEYSLFYYEQQTAVQTDTSGGYDFINYIPAINDICN